MSNNPRSDDVIRVLYSAWRAGDEVYTTVEECYAVYLHYTELMYGARAPVLTLAAFAEHPLVQLMLGPPG